jgi:hypothetical protein
MHGSVCETPKIVRRDPREEMLLALAIRIGIRQGGHAPIFTLLWKELRDFKDTQKTILEQQTIKVLWITFHFIVTQIIQDILFGLCFNILWVYMPQSHKRNDRLITFSETNLPQPIRSVARLVVVRLVKMDHKGIRARPLPRICLRAKASTRRPEHPGEHQRKPSSFRHLKANGEM